jgi:hypothetical protein
MTNVGFEGRVHVLEANIVLCNVRKEVEEFHQRLVSSCVPELQLRLPHSCEVILAQLSSEVNEWVRDIEGLKRTQTEGTEEGTKGENVVNWTERVCVGKEKLKKTRSNVVRTVRRLIPGGRNHYSPLADGGEEIGESAGLMRTAVAKNRRSVLFQKRKEHGNLTAEGVARVQAWLDRVEVPVRAQQPISLTDFLEGGYFATDFGGLAVYFDH